MTNTMLTLTLTLTLTSAALFAGACAQDASSTSSDNADEAELLDSSTFCEVVELLDDELEGSLASIYDFDDDGFPNFDEDATSVAFGRFDGELFLDLGHNSFSIDNGDSFELREDDSAVVSLRAVSEGQLFDLRLFETRVGFVSHTPSFEAIAECVEFGGGTEEECGRTTTLAKIDCRSSVSAPAFFE